jgi:hypothetical protein
MNFFSVADCTGKDQDNPPRGRVFAVKPEKLSARFKLPDHQLFYCGTDALLNSYGSFFSVSLKDRAPVLWNRNDVLGLLKPALLPDTARLQLSQIHPDSTMRSDGLEAEFLGYCFLQNGRYMAGLPLRNDGEIAAYIDMQKDYQHLLKICDSEDNIIFEMADGKLVYPTRQMLIEHAAGEDAQDGGISQNL